MPATPCACWPMSPVNYRGRIVKVLRQGKHGQYHGIFYRGNRFWAAESRGTESLPTVILDALVLRGVEDDSETIARLASSAKFRSASMARPCWSGTSMSAGCSGRTPGTRCRRGI